MLGALALAAASMITGCSGHSCGNADSCSAATPKGVGALSASSFAAINAKGAAVLFSTRAGSAGHQLLPATLDKEQLVDIARDGSRGLIATYSVGPAITSGVAGGDPKPGTCRGQVDRLDLDTGHISELVSVGPNMLVSSVRPNPARTELAMLVSPCVPSYFNQHIEVRRIADGTTWSIGGELPRCHFVGVPAWTKGGRDLLVPYGKAIGSRPVTGQDGVCPDMHRTGLMQVAAQKGQPGLTGLFRNIASHCSYGSVASHGNVTYAIRRCNRNAHDTKASLVRVDTSLRPVHTWTIGQLRGR
jgi:hypothetical protein